MGKAKAILMAIYGLAMLGILIQFI